MRRFKLSQMNTSRQTKPPLEEMLRNSLFYRQCAAESQEIQRHKWLLSEKSGRDVGYNYALMSWFQYHREGWKQHWREIASQGIS